MADDRPIGVDVTGYEVITKAVSELLNQFPGLNGRTVSFEDLTTSGIAFSADNGTLIMREAEDITGHVKQNCQYPFFLIYRSSSTSEKQKVKVQTFLDSFGKWMCKEPAEVGGQEVQLDEYPALANGRKITKVTRMNSYGIDPDDKGVQDWLLPAVAEYTNEFDRF